MEDKSNLIVMLTHNDETVQKAHEIFIQCKNSQAEYWGFKEEPLPADEMKHLFHCMKSFGKKTVLEVVAYSEQEGLEGAKAAAACECDILMGTMYFDSINEFCKNHKLKYMPFVGNVAERPSVLSGSIDDIISEANELITKGVYGFDLLAYRYSGDSSELIKRFVSEVSVPVCIAGSINSYSRLDELKGIKPWAFTIGGAFFENRFGNDFTEQINNVCKYIEESN